MDWVQIYYLVLIFVVLIGFGISLAKAGEPKNEKENPWEIILGLGFQLPIIGRIFEWW